MTRKILDGVVSRCNTPMSIAVAYPPSTPWTDTIDQPLRVCLNFLTLQYWILQELISTYNLWWKQMSWLLFSSDDSLRCCILAWCKVFRQDFTSSSESFPSLTTISLRHLNLFSSLGALWNTRCRVLHTGHGCKVHKMDGPLYKWMGPTLPRRGRQW